jgi:predicted dienelactone hydrolase
VGAAEKIYLTYGPLEFSLSVASLENFAKTGEIDKELNYYLKKFSPQGQVELRDILRASYPIKPLAVSQAFYDPMGEVLLQNVGELIQNEERQNGFYALRAALIQAAAEPQGLTVLGAIRKFPSYGIRLNTSLALQTFNRATNAFQQTEAVIAGIRQMSDKEATQSSVDFATMPDLRNWGAVKFSTQTMTLRDTRRNRTFVADLYLPELTNSTVPVAIISHGLSSSRKNFATLAQYLASYGFAVAVPEHIGSNFEQRQALLAGKAQEIFGINEFSDRPLDITYLLNELEKLNQTNFQNRLNLQQVAAIGHSFGGYTALVLGGATVDFAQLHKDCKFGALNVSLLLQCRALELESSPGAVKLLQEQGLQDKRVQLVVAINPVNSSILGQRGLSRIKVPVVIGASGYDPATPVVPEQAQSFTWLTTPEKYLVLAEGASHTPELTALVNKIIFQAESAQQLEEDRKLFESGVRSLALVFLQVYIAQRPEYRPYLHPAYARTVSKSPFNFSMVRTLSGDKLLQIRQSRRVQEGRGK